MFSVFAFGTPAARMPQLAGDIIKERAAALREAGACQRIKTLEARIGTRQSVLVENPAKAEHRACPCKFEGPATRPNRATLFRCA